MPTLTITTIQSNLAWEEKAANLRMLEQKIAGIEEKTEIARQHLFPKQLEEHGLKPKHFSIDKPQFEKIIEGYTRESGVRGLENKIAQVIRNAAKCLAMDEIYNKSY